ncbi:unnamed protein product [Hydatigera taeniaeformis]|uniref:Uncharacterized protein n=1 Tax=Hydatigena taeniaeformis TaxID=6205 RepID=A0A0R3X710_HYDTA|nr:unnamed protein product [Hydatigera taeniaeformis]
MQCKVESEEAKGCVNRVPLASTCACRGRVICAVCIETVEARRDGTCGGSGDSEGVGAVGKAERGDAISPTAPRAHNRRIDAALRVDARSTCVQQLDYRRTLPRPADLQQPPRCHIITTPSTPPLRLTSLTYANACDSPITSRIGASLDCPMCHRCHSWLRPRVAPISWLVGAILTSTRIRLAEVSGLRSRIGGRRERLTVIARTRAMRRC